MLLTNAHSDENAANAHVQRTARYHEHTPRAYTRTHTLNTQLHKHRFRETRSAYPKKELRILRKPSCWKKSLPTLYIYIHTRGYWLHDMLQHSTSLTPLQNDHLRVIYTLLYCVRVDMRMLLMLY